MSFQSFGCSSQARSIVTALAEGGHRWTEYRLLDKAVIELECPCADLDELPQVCPAADYSA